MNREYIINANGNLFPVFKNPTDEQYYSLVDEFNEQYPFCPSGEPKIRKTYDTNNNEYIWMSGDAMHYFIEQYLYRLDGVTCNQNKYFDVA